MPSFNIIKESEIENTFRVQNIKNSFGIENTKTVETFKGDIPIENEDWNIGLICGHSGTGKSTIAKKVFGEQYFVQPDFNKKSVIDDMPSHEVKTITKTFNSVGFSSVPSWLKPYDVLSTGEKMRVQLAYALLQDNDIFVFDEFTSVVDRTVAKTASYAVQKAIRRNNKKFIAVSCHSDIENWLMPDWVFDTNQMQFKKKI